MIVLDNEKYKIIKRTGSWNKRLRNRIHNYKNNYKDLIKTCPNCDNILVFKSSSYGGFVGCTGYPNCEYTE